MPSRNRLIYQSARYVAYHPLTGAAFLFPNKKELNIWVRFMKGQFGLDAKVSKIEKLKRVM